MKRYAALFGGSGKDKTTLEYNDTVKIGRLLADMGYVVKNGGYGGMMEAVSYGALQQGGEVIGVTCKQVGTIEGNDFLTQTIVTEDLYDRLKVLINNTELFIVQKGGIGTLSEVFLVLDILRKEPIANRPMMFFVGDAWKKVIEVVKKQLLPGYEYELFQIVDGFEELKLVLNSNEIRI
ncbi:LOG family protein [Aquimarina brevivitae]|uniref:Cytokinin riboside 5'-monophosphate phosphoribohydrolase n=1 Tax=Aquimarina brevivitae TaxID=323412 RepID=A0A4Q7P098_9FLAO|nr:LOG family protein [Aquimarina brevivitae]RZS93203.1 hypothetical protein EV197_1774 [Aquimarina brevivitae]